MEINLTITLTCLQLETRIMYYKTFRNRFSTVIGNARLWPSFVICWGSQDSRPRCGPRHPILHSKIFFYIKLFATIILSWNSLKCILWYLFELSDPFIKNENSVLPIWIEKLWTKNLLLSLENQVYFFRKENPIQFGQRLPKSFSQLYVNNSRFFLSSFLKKDDWPKAYADPRLRTLRYLNVATRFFFNLPRIVIFIKYSSKKIKLNNTSVSLFTSKVSLYRKNHFQSQLNLITINFNFSYT